MDEKVASVLRKASEAWRDVMAIYAGAMCSAQILEGELVQVLYFLRIKSGELKEPGFDWAYHQMMRQKPSEVLDWIRGAGGNLSYENEKIIRQALRLRNFLAHEFFHKHNPVMSGTQCKQIASKLKKIDAELETAFELLQPLRQKLETQLGLSVDRQITSTNFQKRFVEAFESFNDE
jgi:hypothetical protein